MRIAIVDDIASERESLHQRLEVQLGRLLLHADISEYESGAGFLSDAREKPFHLVFMDIYIGTENGVDTARELRRFDTDCLLVFATNSTEHALDGFRVRAFQYLVKPYTDEELDDLLAETIRQLPRRFPVPDKYIEVNSVCGGGSARLYFSEILYAEHYRHKIYIYMSDGRKVVTRQTFREFTGKLTDERFFVCNRGVIVNLEYAEDFSGMDFILKNGKCIPVSRNLSKFARIAFGDFLFKRGVRL